MTSFSDTVAKLVAFMSGTLVPLIVAIAALAFLWGVFQYFFLGATDAEKQSQGRIFVLWSLIALAVIFSVWGLVNTLRTTFGV